MKAELTGLIIAQRISFSDKTQKRIEQIWKALDGTLEIPKKTKAKNNMQTAIETFFR